MISEIMKKIDYAHHLRWKGQFDGCPFYFLQDEKALRCEETCGQLFPQILLIHGAIGNYNAGSCPCDVLDKKYVAEKFWEYLDKAQC